MGLAEGKGVAGGQDKTEERVEYLVQLGGGALGKLCDRLLGNCNTRR